MDPELHNRIIAHINEVLTVPEEAEDAAHELFLAIQEGLCKESDWECCFRNVILPQHLAAMARRAKHVELPPDLPARMHEDPIIIERLMDEIRHTASRCPAFMWAAAEPCLPLLALALLARAVREGAMDWPELVEQYAIIASLPGFRRPLPERRNQRPSRRDAAAHRGMEALAQALALCRLAQKTRLSE